jgi:hypothetical protein
VLAPLHTAFLELIIDPACSPVFEAEDSDPNLMHHPGGHCKSSPRRRDRWALVVGSGLCNSRCGLLQSVIKHASNRNIASVDFTPLNIGPITRRSLAPRGRLSAESGCLTSTLPINHAGEHLAHA